MADDTPNASAAVEQRPAVLADRILWGLILTPVAGMLGSVLLPVLRLMIPGPSDPLLDGGVGWWLSITFSFAPIVGGIIAAPVTLLVLPTVRGWLWGRDRVSLLLLALAGLAGGLLSPILISVGTAGPVWPGMGAGSGLVVAVLYFYLTDGTRRIALRSAIFAVLSLCALIPIGASAWNNLQAPRESTDLGELSLDDLIRNKQAPAPFKDVAIDPYASAPVTFYHRPHDTWTPPFEATIKVPPRSLKDFYVRWMAAGKTFAVSAIRMEALLPNLTLRTPNNFELFRSGEHKQDEDVLEVMVGWVQNLGPVPDYWFRMRAGCNIPNLEVDPAIPSLNIDPKHRPSEWGIGIWLACQPEDLLPDGNTALIHCTKNPFTHAFDERCRVEFVLPWKLYGPDMALVRAPRRFQDNGRSVIANGGVGIAASYSFPARRLPEWRRMRELSLCLIEATVVSIGEIAYASRNAHLCSQIKQAIAQRRDALVESSAQ